MAFQSRHTVSDDSAEVLLEMGCHSFCKVLNIILQILLSIFYTLSWGSWCAIQVAPCTLYSALLLTRVYRVPFPDQGPTGAISWPGPKGCHFLTRAQRVPFPDQGPKGAISWPGPIGCHFLARAHRVPFPYMAERSLLCEHLILDIWIHILWISFVSYEQLRSFICMPKGTVR
jgi:hypothetical protein